MVRGPSRRGLLLGVALLLPALARAAGEPRLELELDTTELVQGQTVTARVRLVDGVLRGGRPELPVSEGLSARFVGQSQQHVMVNFQSTRIVDFSFAVTARGVGPQSVGPVEVQVGDRVLRAEGRTVEVKAAPQGGLGETRVEARLSRTQPFVGEVVVYEFRFRTAERVLDVEWTPPAFDGYALEKSAEAARREYSLVEEGRTVAVQEVALALVANGEGRRTIPPALINLRLPARGQDRRSPFLGALESRSLATEPIPTEVRPLPAQGRPSDFSGLVGRFRMDARLLGPAGAIAADAQPRVQQGESLTLEVELEGDGSLLGFKLPPPAPGAELRAYDDAPELSARLVDGAYQAKARFRRAIVPTKEGVLRIDPIEIVAFDPVAERYERLRTPAFELEVAPAAQGRVASFQKEPSGAAPAEVAALGQDILPVTSPPLLYDQRLRAAWPFVLLPPLAPALGLLGLLLGSVRRRRPDPWAALREDMRSLPSEPGARLAAVERAFRGACALRLGRPAPALDAEAVRALGPEALALYEELSRARYGGFEAGGDLERRVRTFLEEA